MSHLGMSSRGKLSFETTFNASMGMSSNSLAKVQFKIDKERIRHQNEVKMLNKIEKEELRLAQRELEEVKKELHALKAYKLVAKQTAFEQFDRVVLKRREKLEKKKHENELRKQGNLETQEETGGSPTPDDFQNEAGKFASGRRRSSASGQVVVTLGDIMDNDDVLRRQSLEIIERRRKSMTSLEDDDDDDDDGERGKHHRKRSELRSWLKTNSSPRRNSIKGKEDKLAQRRKCLKAESEPNLAEINNFSEKQRRKSNIGSIGDLVQTVIREDVNAEKEEEGKEDESCVKSDKDNVDQIHDEVSHVKRLVVSGRKGYRTGAHSPNGFFITSNDSLNDEAKEENFPNKHRFSTVSTKGSSELRPMTLFEISKLYEQNKAQKLEENENKLMNHQRRKSQREYEIFRLKLQQQQHQKRKSIAEQGSLGISHLLKSPDHDQDKADLSNATTDQTSTKEETKCLKSQPHSKAPDQNEPQRNVSDGKSPSGQQELPASAPLTTSFWEKMTSSTQPCSQEDASASAVNDSQPAMTSPIRGLARFKNAAAAVAIQQKLTRKDRNDRMKSVAAAAMIQSKTTKGRVPSSFLSGGAFSWTSPRDDSKTEIPPLEASHRNPNDVIIRPLQMPRSVQAEHEKKWGELMVNVHYAVYWKAKALREDTGTLNSRQVRRQVKEKTSSRKALFPGQCKTTWAMKKYVKQEVDDVLKSWEPDNVRKRRNQQLAEKASLPKFIDRIRTTTSILKSFRRFRKDNNKSDGGHDKENKFSDDDDDDDDDVDSGDDDKENDDDVHNCN